MDSIIQQNPGFILPILFLALWLGVGAFLGAISGWTALTRQYPDGDESPLKKLTFQSGAMGSFGVNMNGILSLGVCPSGLRVGISRIFCVFCQDFFVPWNEIAVIRKDGLLRRRAKLEFGAPTVGFLILDADVADRLARASENKWPEPGPFPPESKNRAFASVAAQWAAMTLVAATFFTVVPRVAGPPDAAPPIAVTILFPAIVLGLVSLFRYLRRIQD